MQFVQIVFSSNNILRFKLLSDIMGHPVCDHHEHKSANIHVLRKCERVKKEVMA